MDPSPNKSLRKLADINKKQVADNLKTMQQHNQSSLANQDTILLSIQGHMNETKQLITSGNSVTQKIADALRLDWLRQLGAELKGFMSRIMAMNVATYHAVIAIQSSLPGRSERSLIDEPFILEDAIGRVDLSTCSLSRLGMLSMLSSKSGFAMCKG
jgi:hypothetical protein